MRQAVEHSRCARRPAVARVRDETGKRDGAERLELAGGGLDQQADLPMPGVVTQRNRLAVGRPQTSLRAEDEELPAVQFGGIPPHAGVLGEAKKVATRPLQQHGFGERQRAGRTGRGRADVIDSRSQGGEDQEAEGTTRQSGGGNAMSTRAQNETKFGTWDELAGGGRLYRLDVPGRHGWRARYLKEVNGQEVTVRFWQEIFDGQGRLVEIHEKYAVDKGYQNL